MTQKKESVILDVGNERRVHKLPVIGDHQLLHVSVGKLTQLKDALHNGQDADLIALAFALQCLFGTLPGS